MREKRPTLQLIAILLFIHLFINPAYSLSPKTTTHSKPNRDQYQKALERVANHLAERKIIKNGEETDLSQEEYQRQNFHYALIYGNKNFQVFDEAAAQYNQGKVKKILISGGIGRMTHRLVEKMSQNPEVRKRLLKLEGYQEVETLIKTREKDQKILETLKKYQISEALLIKEYLITKGLLAKDIETETTSQNTKENVENLHQQFKNRSFYQKAQRILLLQYPLGQKRARRTLEIFQPQYVKGKTLYSYAAEKHTQQETEEGEVSYASSIQDELLLYLTYGVNRETLDKTEGDYPLEQLIQDYQTLYNYSQRISPLEDLAEAHRWLLQSA